MYFADGYVKHVLFMAMVLWNRYIFMKLNYVPDLYKQNQFYLWVQAFAS